MKTKTRYFNKYTSKKQFLAAKLSGATIRRLFQTYPGQVKLLLRHSACPMDIVERYAKHEDWDFRIVAMLAQCRWPDYIEQALRDPKSTVRFCAYRRASFEGYRPRAVRQMLEKDVSLGGYRPYLMQLWRYPAEQILKAAELAEARREAYAANAK